MDLSRQNYSFELLKRGAEDAMDAILDNCEKMEGFDRSDDSWSNREQLTVEFYNCEAILDVDISLDVNGEGEFENGQVEVHKAEIMDSHGDLRLLSEQNLENLSYYLSW